jgi:uncharacterized protein YlzI (FlbEa/FlbD family)
MIHLTLHDGTPVIVNPFHIFSVEALGESGCTIVASGGATVEVTESLDLVEIAIRRWTSGGK